MKRRRGKPWTRAKLHTETISGEPVAKFFVDCCEAHVFTRPDGSRVIIVAGSPCEGCDGNFARITKKPWRRHEGSEPLEHGVDVTICGKCLLNIDDDDTSVMIEFVPGKNVCTCAKCMAVEAPTKLCEVCDAEITEWTTRGISGATLVVGRPTAVSPESESN